MERFVVVAANAPADEIGEPLRCPGGVVSVYKKKIYIPPHHIPLTHASLTAVEVLEAVISRYFDWLNGNENKLTTPKQSVVV